MLNSGSGAHKTKVTNLRPVVVVVVLAVLRGLLVRFLVGLLVPGNKSKRDGC